MLLGTGPLPRDLIVPGACRVGTRISGLYYFRSRERVFADVV